MQKKSKFATPAAEVKINEELIRKLLRSQHSDLAELPLEFIGEGWDNIICRLGLDLTLRMPRRTVGAELILNEQRLLPQIAKKVSFPIPEPIRIGQPEFDYPWNWSICRFVPGKPADVEMPDETQGKPLAEFLKKLHIPATPDLPENEYRGVPLKNRVENVGERLAHLKKKTNLISPVIEKIWKEASEAPDAEISVFLHGDLHPRNVLCENGKFSGIIDWGDMTGGDPATDLASIWLLLDSPKARAEALEIYAPNENMVARTKGWAVFFASILTAAGLADAPHFEKIGRSIFRRLEEDVKN